MYIHSQESTEGESDYVDKFITIFKRLFKIVSRKIRSFHEFNYYLTIKKKMVEEWKNEN